MGKNKQKIYDILYKKEELDLEAKELWLRAKVVLQFIELREQKKLTQAKVAILMSVKRQQISRFENMENSPTLTFLVKYASVLGTELDILLKGVSLTELK